MAKFYLIIIFFVICILSGLNSIFAITIYNAPVWTLISAVLSSFALIVIIDTFFAILIGIMPKSWFCVKNKCFHVSKKEQKFYERFKIRKWKDYVWELGGLGGFSKRKIKNPKDPKYFERFIIESNRGVTEHILGMFFGFGIIFAFPNFMWTIGIPIAIVNVILNVLPTMILRYNMPKLKAVHAHLVRKSTAENLKP